MKTTQDILEQRLLVYTVLRKAYPLLTVKKTQDLVENLFEEADYFHCHQKNLAEAKRTCLNFIDGKRSGNVQYLPEEKLFRVYIDEIYYYFKVDESGYLIEP